VEVGGCSYKTKWPVRAENCPSRAELNRLGIQEQEIKKSGTDKSFKRDPSASDGFNQIRLGRRYCKIFAIAFPERQIENIKQTTAATPQGQPAPNQPAPHKSANSKSG